MDIKKGLKDVASKVEAIVLTTLENEALIASEISPLFKDLYAHLLSIATGGKGLRGALVYYSYKLFTDKEEEDIYKVAAAIELYHLYLLIHDDVMDRADTRHGKNTINEIYAKGSESIEISRSEWEHFGNSEAINAGDILSHLSTKLILDTSFSAESKVRVVECIQRHLIHTGYGQFMDVWGGVYDKLSEEDVMQVYRYKTGNYTFENPMMVGAILGGATEEDLKHLQEFAIPCGITYQVVDDILGLYSDTETLGKPILSDLKEGKRTILVVYAGLNINEEQNARLEWILGNQNITMEHLQEAQKLVEESGALEHARKIARASVETAKDALLGNFDKNHTSIQFLVGLSDYIISRDR
jgi:geranylgeranyl diphosphate synthase type I